MFNTIKYVYSYAFYSCLLQNTEIRLVFLKIQKNWYFHKKNFIDLRKYQTILILFDAQFNYT
jgi:hypothetical protein